MRLLFWLRNEIKLHMIDQILSGISKWIFHALDRNGLTLTNPSRSILGPWSNILRKISSVPGNIRQLILTITSSFFLELNLVCWGTWDDDQFKFVVLSKPTHQAHYIMVSIINHKSQYVPWEPSPSPFPLPFPLSGLSFSSRHGIMSGPWCMSNTSVQCESHSVGTIPSLL